LNRCPLVPTRLSVAGRSLTPVYSANPEDAVGHPPQPSRVQADNRSSRAMLAGPSWLGGRYLHKADSKTDDFEVNSQNRYPHSGL